VAATEQASDTGSEQLAETIAASWDFSDARASEVRFRALAEQHAARGDLAGARVLMTQVARAQGLDRRFAEAHATLDAVLAAPELAQPLVQVRYLLERGRVFNSSKDPERARALFEQAWSLARPAGIDDLAVDAAHMIAITFITTPERALEWNDIGLELARASTNPRARRWLGPLLNNQAWTRFDRQEYPLALGLFEEALAFRAQGPDTLATRIAGYCVARTLRALGRLSEAIERLELLLSRHGASGKTSGFVLEELGECHLERGDAEIARGYFARAHRELSEDARFAEDEAERLQRIAKLGGVS
jgi:tetratricopeptide (TPR) repeat protein